MKLKLPKIAETLLQATNEKDVNKYMSCFAEGAIYSDVGESETVVGKSAIEKNFREMKYEIHSVPIDIEETPEKITMKVITSGNFEGSPLNFEYQIKIQSGLIQDLKVDLID